MESTFYNEQFTKILQAKHRIKEAAHESSGIISPSKLCKPTIEAVLQLLGVPNDPPSDQSLRYFLRGETFETLVTEAIAEAAEGSCSLQEEAVYRNAAGYIDAFTTVPHEVKSAGNYTFKRVTKDGKPLHHHALQASFYALGKQTETAWIHYLSTDTLQIVSFRVEAKEYQRDVDSRIDDIVACFASGVLPDYIPLDDFHKSIRYSDYAMFFNKKGDEAEAILKQYYPTAYTNLKNKTLYERILNGHSQKTANH